MAARKVAAFRTNRLSRAGNHQRAGRVSPHTVENSRALLQLRLLCFGLLQDGDVEVGGVFQCGLWFCCAKNRFSQLLAADSSSSNSGLPRSFTSSGSDCNAWCAQ